MKSKIAPFLTCATFAVAVVVVPLQAGHASVAEWPAAASAPVDEEGCGDAGAYEMTHTVIPSIVVRICNDCRFTEDDRYALLKSYGDGAVRAGYIVDPLNSSVLAITETGALPDGKPYLKGVIGDKQLTVGDPYSGETLATVTGKMALLIVSRQ